MNRGNQKKENIPIKGKLIWKCLFGVKRYSPESPGQVPYGLASLPTQITDLLLNNCGRAKEISEAYVELEQCLELQTSFEWTIAENSLGGSGSNRSI